MKRDRTSRFIERLLRSHVGKGVYVRDRRPYAVEAAAYLTPAPAGYAYELLDVAEVRPPAQVSQALDLAAEETAILRHRLLRYADEPVELSWSYYPAELVRGSELTKRRKIKGGAPQVLADLGYPQRSFLDRLSVRLPTTDELETLALPADVPVIRQMRVVYSTEGRPVEASILVKGGHLYELLYRQMIPE